MKISWDDVPRLDSDTVTAQNKTITSSWPFYDFIICDVVNTCARRFARYVQCFRTYGSGKPYRRRRIVNKSPTRIHRTNRVSSEVVVIINHRGVSKNNTFPIGYFGRPLRAIWTRRRRTCRKRFIFRSITVAAIVWVASSAETIGNWFPPPFPRVSAAKQQTSTAAGQRC